MRNKELRVCILGVYIGKLPEYFDCWLESCGYNTTIDFIIITDQILDSHFNNVRVFNLSLEDIGKRASKKLGFEVSLKTPFKLCDFKPAYGIIFSELFEGYDYWGYCDFDLIWGDIRKFFVEYDLASYDKFLPLGHLTLYRNTAENNVRFMDKIKGYSDYQKIYTDDRSYIFDELALVKIFEKNQYSCFDKIIFADIWPSKKRYTLVTGLKYYPSIYQEYRQRCYPVNYKKQVFLWEDGHVFHAYLDNEGEKKREYMYIHIQKRKWKANDTLKGKIVICGNRMICLDKETNVDELISRYNPYSFLQETRDVCSEFLMHCWSYAKRKILKIEKDRFVVENK